MLFYIVILIGLFLATSNRKILSAKIYAIMITLVAVFRYGCGADYFSYYYLYDKIKPSFISEIVSPSIPQEVGFRLIGVCFKVANLPYQILIATFAAISIYFIYKTCVKYSNNPTFSLVIYFACYYIYWTYSSLRQGIVMAMGIYFLLQAIYEKKEAKFLIITLLLATIHQSALFLIVLYFVSKIKITKRTLLVLLIVAVGMSLVPLGSIANMLASYIPVFQRLSYYIDAPSSLMSSLFDFQTVGRLVFMVIAFFFYNSYCNESAENRKIMNMYIFSFVIYFIFKFSELAAARLAIYGKVLDILILTNIIGNIKVKFDKQIFIAFIVILMFMYMYKDLSAMEVQASLIDTRNLFTPYVNIFNKEQFVFDTYYIERLFQ